MDPGENPPGMDWHVIKTAHFEIVFPSKVRKEAQKTANTLEAIYTKGGKTLLGPSERFTVILQNQPVQSNGFVNLAPQRSEFYTTPPQDNEASDWVMVLGIHEYRHMVQFTQMDQGFSKFLRTILGEETGMALFGMTLPPWFFEGDAVLAETGLTYTGRGRMPSWKMGYRSNLLTGNHYSYNKNVLGSMKDYVPNHYQIGYFLTAYARQKYGAGIWGKVLEETARKAWIPWSFRRATNKYTGHTLKELHADMQHYTDSAWDAQTEGLQQTPFQTVNERKDSVYTQYLLPHFYKDSVVVCLKKGLGTTPRFVKLHSDGTEEVLYKTGLQNTDHFDLKRETLVWDEVDYDLRWQYETFSVLKTLDLETGKINKLTTQSRLFAPSLSPDAEKLVAVRVSEGNIFELVVMDATTGERIHRIHHPDNYLYQTPVFGKDSTEIIAVVSSKKGKSIVRIDVNTGKHEFLIPFTYENIARPVKSAGRIFYQDPSSGIVNIYCYDLQTDSTFQVTSVKTGARFPAIGIKKDKLAYSRYTATGEDVVKMPLDSGMWKPAGKVEKSALPFHQTIKNQESGPVLDSVPDSTYTSEPYASLKHLFYFHSLSPDVDGPDYNRYDGGQERLGMALRSDNKLTNSSLSAGYYYDLYEQAHVYSGALQYRGLWPHMTFQYTNGGFSRNIVQRVQSDTFSFNTSWRQHLYQFDLSVPLNLSEGNQFRHIGIRAGTFYKKRYAVKERPYGFIDEIRFPMDYYLAYSGRERQSARDFAPRFSQFLSFRFTHTPFTPSKGQRFAISSEFTFPGIARHHRIRLGPNYQYTEGIFAQDRMIAQPRGSGKLNPSPLYPYTLRAGYSLPLFYPDWGLGRVAYFKRFRLTGFMDFGSYEMELPDRYFSTGVELVADLNLFRFMEPLFEVGGRVNLYHPSLNQKPAFQLLLGYNL